MKNYPLLSCCFVCWREFIPDVFKQKQVDVLI
jgi:hypothetical protein